MYGGTLKKYLRFLVLVPLPILLVILSQWETNAWGPYYERQNYDPEYQYLLNGLNLLEGRPPFHIDHPGTTLQMLTAAIIGLRQSVLDDGVGHLPDRQDVLLHPEAYLHAVRNALLIGAAALYLLMAVQVYRKTGLLWAAVGFELFAFLGRNLIHSLVRVSPEPLLLSLVLLVTAVLVQSHGSEILVRSWPRPLLLGAILGVGLVTKLTFLPLLLLVLWFPRWRDRILALLAALASLLVLTIPIWTQASRVIHWIGGLIGRQGRYGAGPSGWLPPLSSVAAHATSLATEEPFYFVVLAVVAALCVVSWLRRGSASPLDRLRISLMLGILLVQLLIVAKYGTAHYLVPGLAFLGAIYVLMILRFRAELTRGGMARRVVPVVLLTALSALAAGNLFSFARSVARTAGLHQDTLLLDARLQVEFDGCGIIPYYGATDMRYALDLANGFAGESYSETLGRLHPGTITYNIWDRTFNTFTSEVPHNEIQSRLDLGECLLLRGGYFLPGAGEPNHDGRLDLEVMIAGEREIVYRLNAILPQDH